MSTASPGPCQLCLLPHQAIRAFVCLRWFSGCFMVILCLGISVSCRQFVNVYVYLTYWSFVLESESISGWSPVWLCDATDWSSSGSSVHGILQQEYWSGLPCPSPGDLPDQGIEPGYPALQADSLPSEPPGINIYEHCMWLLYEHSDKDIGACWLSPESIFPLSLSHVV